MVYRNACFKVDFELWQTQHQKLHSMRGILQRGLAPFQITRRQIVGLPLAYFKDRARMRFGLREQHRERTMFLQSVPLILPPWKRVDGCGGSGSPRIRQRKQWQQGRASSFQTPRQFPPRVTTRNACGCYRRRWRRGPSMCRNQYRSSGKMLRRSPASNWSN